jgi:hypothetical protein
LRSATRDAALQRTAHEAGFSIVSAARISLQIEYRVARRASVIAALLQVTVTLKSAIATWLVPHTPA